MASVLCGSPHIYVAEPGENDWWVGWRYWQGVVRRRQQAQIVLEILAGRQVPRHGCGRLDAAAA
jgi:hypothetical protein